MLVLLVLVLVLLVLVAVVVVVVAVLIVIMNQVLGFFQPANRALQANISLFGISQLALRPQKNII